MVLWFKALVIALFAFVMDQFWFAVTLRRVYYPAISAVTKAPPRTALLPSVLSWGSLGLLVAILSDQCPSLYTQAPAIGFLVYGIYNFTVKALFPDYPWVAVALDLLWGALLTTLLFHLHVSPWEPRV